MIVVYEDHESTPATDDEGRALSCPICRVPFAGYSSTYKMYRAGAILYELSAHCDSCRRWYTRGYQRMPWPPKE